MNLLFNTCAAAILLLFCCFHVNAQGADFKELEPVFTPVGYQTGIESIELMTAFDNPDLEEYYKYLLNLSDEHTVYKPICRFDHDEKYSSVVYLEIREKPGYLPGASINMQTIDKIARESIASLSWGSTGTKNLKQYFQEQQIRLSSHKENGIIYVVLTDADETRMQYFDVDAERWWSK